MIEISKLNGHVIMLNPELIETPAEAEVASIPKSGE